MSRKHVALAAALILGFLFTQQASAGDLVRGVRSKIAAGDLLTGAAQVEDYKRATGVDAEYLDAVGWLARGAEMLRRPDLAREYIAELRRNIAKETPELLVPLGAAIEVEGKLVAARDGRGAAIRYLEGEYTRAQAPSLRSRIRKNINLLSLEGQPAPEFDSGDFLAGTTATTLAQLHGKPVLLYFFAAGCGDCKAQSTSLARVWQSYKARGLAMVAVTRLQVFPQEKPPTPEEERAEIEKAWHELYSGLEGVPLLLSTDSMIRYGVSATPTFALVDRRGVVRLYTPTRVSEAELSRRIDELLAE